MRSLARRTWRFFEELLTPADNCLIPDNYQEDRADVIAHRTSPTNIGLQLLSVLSAHDFGYLTATEVVDRLEPTFDTLLKMQRYRGHFYNWYDTRSLVPLAPPYISTVDSGNLAGYLLTLRSGLFELTGSRPLIDASALEGLEDVLGLFDTEVAGGARSAARTRLEKQVDELRTIIAARPAKRAIGPSSSSIRRSWLYFATRSLREAEPVLIWPQPVATARSAIVASSVSPLRWLIMHV